MNGLKLSDELRAIRDVDSVLLRGLSARARLAMKRARRILKNTRRQQPPDSVLRLAIELSRVEACGHPVYSSTGLEDLTLCKCSDCHHTWKVAS